MKAVAGVDLGGAYSSALALLRALRIQGTEVHFVNAVEPILPDGSYPELAAVHPVAQIYADLQKAGTAVVERAALDWPGSSSQVLMGQAASCLLDASEKPEVDLLVVGSREKSLIESFFAGSVTKILATASEKSVLIGKKPPRAMDGLTVVIADDLSDYSTRAIDRFLKWAPKGVSKAVVLTADMNDAVFGRLAKTDDDDAAEKEVRWMIESRHEGLVTELSALGVAVESYVTDRPIKQAVNETMARVDADLLVLGAHGHGFVERLVIGSLALHEVVREPHNVLLMRA